MITPLRHSCEDYTLINLFIKKRKRLLSDGAKLECQYTTLRMNAARRKVKGGVGHHRSIDLLAALILQTVLAQLSIGRLSQYRLQIAQKQGA